MLTGIFGGSLIVELLIAYIVVMLVYEKLPNKWLYALFSLLALHFIFHLGASGWSDLFSGNWDSIFGNLFQ
jgi:hypothetical protein